MKTKSIVLGAALLVSAMGARSQNYLRHGIGAGIGLDKQGDTFLTSWGLEYEMSILNQKKGFESGFVTGAGVSLPIEKADQYGHRPGATYDPREFGVYLKAGYKLEMVSVGINAGIYKEKDRELADANQSKAIIGGWAGMQPARFLTVLVGYDTFRGINAGVLFYVNKIPSNRR